MDSFIRSRFSRRLLLSYVLVILVSVGILALTSNLAIPSYFDNHMRSMGAGMAGMMGDTTNSSMMGSLYEDFRIVFTQSLLLGIVVALLVAVLVSALISRRVVAPVQQMMLASQRIAEGRFDERVNLPGSVQGRALDELDQLAYSFNRMAEQLEQIERRRSELIGDVSHELRTPLSAIKGSMEALEDGVLTPDAETFRQIQKEASRMERLVEDLQELSRVEAHAFTLNLQPLPLQPLVAEVTRHLEHTARSKGITVLVDLPASLPVVMLDEDRMRQVMTNLLGNALQYSPVNGRVEISAYQQAQELVISVRDEGIGIPAEHLKLIFTRFYRVDKSRSRDYGGSGIGLTIARHLVEAHGGELWAESQGEGKGSTFFFTLRVSA